MTNYVYIIFQKIDQKTFRKLLKYLSNTRYRYCPTLQDITKVLITFVQQNRNRRM